MYYYYVCCVKKNCLIVKFMSVMHFNISNVKFVVILR